MIRIERAILPNADGIATAVAKQLAGDAVWVNQDDTTPVAGLRRALAEAGAYRDAIVQCLAYALVNDDVMVRSGAVAMVDTVIEHLGANHVIELLTTRADLFFSVTPSASSGLACGDLGTAMVIALARTPEANDARVLALLRKAACANHGLWVLPDLARLDPSWLMQNANKIPALCPWSPSQRATLLRLLNTAQRRAEASSRAP